MEYRINISASAENDISNAYDRFKHEASLIAERWLMSLFNSMFSLKKMPERCAFIPESDEFNLPLRQLLHGKRASCYRIIFIITESIEIKPQVDIVRVWHTSRDRIKLEDIVL